ncbi:MAG: methyltransferase family protein [Promethearchaeota archaeon]
MYQYIFCIGICTLLWIINGRWLIHSIKKNITSETYIHAGLGTFLSLLTFELTLGIYYMWIRFDILFLKIVGFILYVPSAYLVIAALLTLKHKGQSHNADFTETTVFIDTGIYKFIRQPLTLGLTIWSIALILVFQSIFAIILGIFSMICFRMSAIKEAEYNIKKFGDDYKRYIDSVPIWNIFKGLKQD